jgi:hypothetical protein
MRLPFDMNDSQFASDARIKFSYTAPELNQNIEISIDGDKVSVDALLETYERFLSALGVCIPSNVMLGFVQADEGDEDDDDEDDDDDGDSGISFTLDDDPKDSGKGRKKK